MRSFSKKLSATIFSILFIAIFITLTCCTKVDDRLGLNFIPGDQQMSIRLDTFGLRAGEEITTYSEFRSDSIPTTYLGYTLFGRTKDARFGKTEAASVIQMMPTLRDEESDELMYFGHNPTIDSIKMLFLGNFIGGNKDAIQKFDAYALLDTLAKDSVYYNDFPYERLIDKTKPLFTIEITPDRIADDYYYYHDIEPTELGWEYFHELIADTTYFYGNRNKFHEKFHGMAFVPAEDSPEEGAIYRMDLRNGSYGFAMGVYMHNYESPTSDVIKDSLVVQDFQFSDIGTSDGVPRNVSVLSLRHDYTGTPVEESLELGDIPQSKAYVQSLGGVMTKVTIPDEIFDRLNSIAEEANGKIYLNQVMMYIYLEDDSIDALDESHQKLGSYTKFFKNTTIPDYSLVSEYASGSIPYNGTLNRTHGYYSMDITTFFHWALQNKDNGRSFTLASPSHYNGIGYYAISSGVVYQSDAFNYENTILSGAGSDNPIRLKITYSLIK